MANARPINPNSLPWFPFYATEWLSSETVSDMSMTERGIYTTLMAMCWRDGSLSWNDSRLAKKLGIDRRTVGRFLEKYRHLTSPLQKVSLEPPSLIHEDSTKVTFPKLQVFAEKLAKNAAGPKQSRGEQRDREEKIESSSAVTTSSSHAATLSPSSRVQTGRNKPEESRSVQQANRSESAATISRPGPELPDIREWPEREDRFGISGTRIRNCIIYQLDFLKSPWYRAKAFPTVGKLNSEGYVIKLDADTPAGWTPKEAEAEQEAKQSELNKYRTKDVAFI